jgi:protein gp37
MSSSSAIEWTNATWNPVMGCTKVSQGCKNCYAERLWPKVEGARVKREGGEPRPFTHVSTLPDRLDAPLHWTKARRIFVNSMSDLFHENVPDEFVLQVFDVMRQSENGHAPKLGRLIPQHTFQILTKRPERMRDFCRRIRFAQNDGRGLYLAGSEQHQGFNPMSLLKHVWLGVSVEDQATADERIPLLLQTPAAVRWISAEPLLGRVDLQHLGIARGRWLNALTCDYIDATNGDVIAGPPTGSGPLDWVVAGGESGPKARPSHPDWFRSLRDQCRIDDVPFFFKQWGEWASVSQVEGKGDHHHFDDGATVRRVGKQIAGRQLDGREWNEYPA